MDNIHFLTPEEFLASDSKENNVKCQDCGRTYKGHLYCIRYFILPGKRKNYQGKYTVGCTHYDFDCENWCGGCYTIGNGKVICSDCGKLDWGRPDRKNGSDNITYTWIDGSTSSFSNPQIIV